MEQGKKQFCLEDISAKPKKATYKPPRIKVSKEFSFTSNSKDIKWFVDTYNYEGEYIGDLHLFIREGEPLYGDIGIVLNAKEDLDDFSTPCVTYTVMDSSSGKKVAFNVSLLLSQWELSDMEGSKLGKDNSFGKIGIPIRNYESLEKAEIISCTQLVKGVLNAKAMLSGASDVASSKKQQGQQKQEGDMVTKPMENNKRASCSKKGEGGRKRKLGVIETQLEGHNLPKLGSTIQKKRQSVELLSSSTNNIVSKDL